jgi:hypothetical protein
VSSVFECVSYHHLLLCKSLYLQCREKHHGDIKDFHLWDITRVAEIDICLFNAGFFFDLVFDPEDEAKCSRRRLAFNGAQSVISQETELFIKKNNFPL